MRVLALIFLGAFVATTNSSLLEMSQTLWSKLLEGGLTKIGVLDPLRVPIVKVDQSEGNTSYRMILRSVEIIGLNSSSLESVHIARGRLKTNLSEHEAGYVSYTDQRELDTIRYRFHTVVKEPKGEDSRNLQVQPIEDSHDSKTIEKNDNSSRNVANHQISSSYRDNRQRIVPQGQRPTGKYEDDERNQRIRTNYESSRKPEEQYYSQPQNSQKTSKDFRVEYQTPRQQESSMSFASSRFSSDEENIKNPGRVRIVYADRQRYPQDNSQTKNQRANDEAPDCIGSCDYRRNQGYSGRVRDNQRDEFQKNKQDEDIGVAASINFESRKAYVDARMDSGRNQDESGRGQYRYNNGPTNENRYAMKFDQKVDDLNNKRMYQRYEEGPSQMRMENQPGYVDIVYANEKDHKMRRFGNLMVESGRDTTVYSFDDVLRDLRDQKRFIVHNFTEGEALMKKNDAVRTASETKRIKDMVRYAREFQEMQGYYEQGMQLIYHYGDRDNEENIKVKDGKRTKRAHLDEKDEDDIMHVIMRIRVPMLRVNAGYVLMGKVGKQVLRGNGLLTGNFTELIGDFTLELKKIDDDTMIVRAARARLTAKDKNITLQGMDDEGPVKEILTHGLMAAEAVAAMLADDLATKALSENTADSIIYRMYKNLPMEN